MPIEVANNNTSRRIQKAKLSKLSRWRGRGSRSATDDSLHQLKGALYNKESDDGIANSSSQPQNRGTKLEGEVMIDNVSNCVVCGK
jgi:hypothetical protein